MTQAVIERPWIVVIAVMLALLALEELFARESVADFGAGRIATNFLLNGLGLALLGLMGNFIPSWPVDTDRALIPGFGLAGWLQMPWIVGLGTLFVVDSLFGYWVHRASHHLKPLWRLHAVHHTDRAVDVTTGIRHHPLETLPALAGQLMAIVICGATPAQAILVSLVNSFWALFTHAAIGRHPLDFGRPMRFLVSPAFHRLHHSCEPRLTNSNYGNSLAFWDLLFNTARDPRVESAGEIGLGPQFDRDQNLGIQLLLPFRWSAP